MDDAPLTTTMRWRRWKIHSLMIVSWSQIIGRSSYYTVLLQQSTTEEINLLLSANRFVLLENLFVAYMFQRKKKRRKNWRITQHQVIHWSCSLGRYIVVVEVLVKCLRERKASACFKKVSIIYLTIYRCYYLPRNSQLQSSLINDTVFTLHKISAHIRIIYLKEIIWHSLKYFFETCFTCVTRSQEISTPTTEYYNTPKNLIFGVWVLIRHRGLKLSATTVIAPKLVFKKVPVQRNFILIWATEQYVAR